ncbi:LOW QUALITY PROTEIN: hypothetical protein BU14_0081s0001 [Porphyra umbilicalis]|uniref:Uncharacterized protein n=1 Tax=Porphyra umbilicalis TaxID=2786 RepID=A0A1X6PEN2_PORUM|nr:LOW QUALITY PROTEIN: hypothetical protein BU14_0081s0001 [Porphyra umbilicalis]|eukprot:OSX79319.1 LOW QUALITY PROTEIN: hypothetical protein BU14_0081s0001 [Porphyra umbilicalis]
MLPPTSAGTDTPPGHRYKEKTKLRRVDQPRTVMGACDGCEGAGGRTGDSKRIRTAAVGGAGRGGDPKPARAASVGAVGGVARAGIRDGCGAHRQPVVGGTLGHPLKWSSDPLQTGLQPLLNQPSAERPQTKTRPNLILRQQHCKRKAKENTDKAATAVIDTKGRGRRSGTGCGPGDCCVGGGSISVCDGRSNAQRKAEARRRAARVAALARLRRRRRCHRRRAAADDDTNGNLGGGAAVMRRATAVAKTVSSAAARAGATTRAAPLCGWRGGFWARRGRAGRRQELFVGAVGWGGAERGGRGVEWRHAAAGGVASGSCFGATAAAAPRAPLRLQHRRRRLCRQRGDEPFRVGGRPRDRRRPTRAAALMWPCVEACGKVAMLTTASSAARRDGAAARAARRCELGGGLLGGRGVFSWLGGAAGGGVSGSCFGAAAAAAAPSALRPHRRRRRHWRQRLPEDPRVGGMPRNRRRCHRGLAAAYGDDKGDFGGGAAATGRAARGLRQPRHRRQRGAARRRQERPAVVRGGGGAGLGEAVAWSPPYIRRWPLCGPRGGNDPPAAAPGRVTSPAPPARRHCGTASPPPSLPPPPIRRR